MKNIFTPNCVKEKKETQGIFFKPYIIEKPTYTRNSSTSERQRRKYVATKRG